MTDVVFELEHVSFRYQRATAPTLEDVSLSIRRGEFVGIIGPTGSGKTTLLYLLAGVIPHYLHGDLTGEVRFAGQPTRALSLAQLSAHVGVVLQDPEAQLFNLLVRDELAWGLENRGLPRAEIAGRIERTLRFFGIERLRERITYDLSGGEKQRVAVGAIHAISPEIYLFDNPTSQLDPVGATTVIEAVRRLVDTHRLTIVMVEDKVDELVQHADRLLLLDRGRVVLDCPPREFCLQRDALEAAGVRPPQIAELSYALLEAGLVLDSPPITLEEATPLFEDLLARRSAARSGAQAGPGEAAG